MSPNKTATKEISAPQTFALQTSAPQTSTSPKVLLNPWGGLKQLADLTLDLDAMVAWQLERHLHWAGPRTPWTSYDEIHQALDIRTAHELRNFSIMGRGNTGLWNEHAWYRPDPPSRERDLPWGKPAEALARCGQQLRRSLPKDWLWTIQMRMLLLPLEKWYFNLSYEKRQEMGLNIWRWPLPWELKRAINEAFDSFYDAAAPET